MASDESRPGSSASNSTSSSEQFENGSQSQSSSRRSRSNSVNSNSSSSRDNSPELQTVHLKGPQSPAQVEFDGQENNDSQSRSISRASNQSDVTNNSSDNDGNGSLQSGQNSNLSEKQQPSRSQSVSPTRKSNSRNSSVSSVPDAVISSAEQSRHDAINMSHEDLSDVSDLESATASPANDDDKEEEEEEEEIEETVTDGKAEPIIDLRHKINERKQECKQIKEGNKNSPSIVDELNEIMDKKHDEDALDFEAEDGECEEKESQAPPKVDKEEPPKKPDSDGEINENDELEEGEVSDEDEKRPEETEPKPVCRFYTRGQCTWGMSCRFLHPGVTDKGNYTMFDMIRPVPVNAHAPPYGPGGIVPAYHDFRSERPPMHHPMHGFGNGAPPQSRPPIAEPIVESAWERGLRTAKEMMRKANKRKEQDMDFEDKKMNLSASQDEIEKDNYYIRERSPEIASPPFGVRPGMHHPAMGGYSPPQRIGIPPRGVPMPFENEDPYNRSLRYRELPPHRMPQYEDEIHRQKMRPPVREVIVQRVEPVGRGDEWNDPWMRSKSPVREKRTKRRSYSSNSSYSSSSDSSSKSGSSSNSSRSPSPNTRRRRYSSTHANSHKSPVRGRHLKRSPTPVELHKRRGAHSPVQVHPMNEEAHFEAKKDLRNHPTLSKRANPNIVGRRSSPPKKRQLTPPNVDKRITRSPLTKRKRASPPAPPPRKPISFSLPKSNNLQKRKRASTSGSGSSGSSGSESDSSDSSSSSGSSNDGHKSRTRDKVVSERKMANKKVEATRKRSPPTSSAQNKALADGTINSSSKSSSSASAANSKKSTRREELLKQLRAVEDAIARKRSKLT